MRFFLQTSEQNVDYSDRFARVFSRTVLCVPLPRALGTGPRPAAELCEWVHAFNKLMQKMLGIMTK